MKGMNESQYINYLAVCELENDGVQLPTEAQIKQVEVQVEKRVRGNHGAIPAAVEFAHL